MYDSRNWVYNETGNIMDSNFAYLTEVEVRTAFK